MFLYYQRVIVNYLSMNLDHNKDGFPEMPPFLSDQASPYLSPFHGLQSDEESNSFDRMPGIQIDHTYGMQHREEYEEEYSINKNQGGQNLDEYDNQEEERQENHRNRRQVKVPILPSDNKDQSTIKAIIIFLIENDDISEVELTRLGRPLYEDSRDSQFIFQVLMHKFIKLYKTKQQMTKYCMRKAFKFIGDIKMKPKRKGSSKSRKDENDGCFSLEMPFKKNSQQKTMNANFLKRTFSQKEFFMGYKQFLKNFKGLIEEDNQAKVDFLAQMIQKLIKAKEIEKIENIKRLPWTKTILTKTEDLAKKLMEYGQENSQNIENPE